MLVILSFGCYLELADFRGDHGGIGSFRMEQLFRERHCRAGVSAH